MEWGASHLCLLFWLPFGKSSAQLSQVSPLGEDSELQEGKEVQERGEGQDLRLCLVILAQCMDHCITSLTGTGAWPSSCVLVFFMSCYGNSCSVSLPLRKEDAAFQEAHSGGSAEIFSL